MDSRASKLAYFLRILNMEWNFAAAAVGTGLDWTNSITRRLSVTALLSE